jgi:hypothetical protein
MSPHSSKAGSDAATDQKLTANSRITVHTPSRFLLGCNQFNFWKVMSEPTGIPR